MPKIREPRPPKVDLPASPTNANRDAVIKSLLARLARLEADDDQRAARVAALRDSKP